MAESAQPVDSPLNSGLKPRDAIRAAVTRHLKAAQGADGPPPTVSDHALLHRIGSGAYGDVWLARNTLGTLRAVKVVYRASFQEDRPYEREFQGMSKYEPISRTHPGLVQVLHVGRNDAAGCFYYVMELADPAPFAAATGHFGENSPPPPAAATVADPSCDLADYCPRTLRAPPGGNDRLPPTQAAQVVLRLADALGHLHAHGLVHRDIKPSNIIFVGGEPKLADIGLVTDAGHSHSFVGTEGFIPPEGPGTPPADLYGLGKLLYELATGHDRMEFPQLPQNLARGADGQALMELNEVMNRACAPDPRHRYRTATELQADLNLFLAGRSLRRTRNIERHLARLKQFALAGCGLLAVAAAALWFAKNEERHANERARLANERARAEAFLRQRAEEAEQATQLQLHTALYEQARATIRSGEVGQRIRALDALGRAAAITNTPELRREALAALALPDLHLRAELPTDEDTTFAVLDPTFERIALGRGPGPVEIRRVEDRSLLATLPAGTNLAAHLAFWSADGRYFAVKRDHDTAGTRADAEVWEVGQARRVLHLRHTSYNALSFNPRLPQFMAGTTSSNITTWNLANGQLQNRFLLPSAPLHLEIAPDGDRFAAVYHGSEGTLLSVHNALEGSTLATWTLGGGVAGVRWHPDGRSLAIPEDTGGVSSLDALTGERRLFGRHKAEAATVEYSPDGRYLMSGGWERELVCWDLATRQRAFTIGLQSYRMQWRADAQACALVRPGLVQLHAFERPTGRRKFGEDLGARLRWAAFSPDGRWLAAAGDERLGVWDLTRGSPGGFDAAGYGMRLQFTPDSRELFGSRTTRNSENCLRWGIVPAVDDAGSPLLRPLPLKKPEGFTSLSLVADSIVFTGTRGSQVLPRADLGTGADVSWTGTISGVNGVSPDHRWLGVYFPYRPQLFVHQLPDLHQVAKLVHLGPIGFFEFSPLGHEVVTASSRGIVFWDTIRWEQTRALTNFTRPLYSADGHGLWLTKDVRAAGLYDAATLEPQLLLPNGVIPLAISSDNRRLAASIDWQRLEMWDLEEFRAQFRRLGLDWGKAQPLNPLSLHPMHRVPD